MDICREQFLDDIIKVRVYLSSNCQTAIPVNVGGIKEAQVTLGTPIIELGIADDMTGTAQGLLSQCATVKVTSKREKTGMVYTHEINGTVESGMDDIAQQVQKLTARDVHIIYIKADGSMYLSYTLPNTCVLTTEDNLGTSYTQTFKATAKSMSALITAKNPT